MILMALFSLVLIVGMPYLMENSKLDLHVLSEKACSGMLISVSSGSRDPRGIRGDAEEKPSQLRRKSRYADSELRLCVVDGREDLSGRGKLKPRPGSRWSGKEKRVKTWDKHRSYTKCM